jgi:hypothetical protein
MLSMGNAHLAGAGGTLLSGFAEGVLPGICAAVLLSTGAAGAVTAAPSSTLPEEAAGLTLLKYASIKVHTKKTAANTAVVRDKKLAPPVAPNKLPEPPLPKAAPMSAPLPCWIKIKPIMANADSI